MKNAGSDNLTPEDVKRSIGDYDVISAALANRTPVKHLLRHKPSFNTLWMKNYVLFEATRKDSDGLDCKVQLTFSAILGKPTGLVAVRVIWAGIAKNLPFQSLDEAVEAFCGAHEDIPTASMRNV